MNVTMKRSVLENDLLIVLAAIAAWGIVIFCSMDRDGSPVGFLETGGQSYLSANQPLPTDRAGSVAEELVTIQQNGVSGNTDKSQNIVRQ